MNAFAHTALHGPHQYRPEWDVPSMFRETSDRLAGAIAAARKSSVATDRRIQVILGEVGDGKTHVISRVVRREDVDATPIFIPQIENVSKPRGHIRRAIVESLFDDRGASPTLIESLLTRLLGNSFHEYFEQLPERLKTRFPAGPQFAGNADSILELTRAIGTGPAFVKLARSVAASEPFSGLSGDVIRTLVTGWSPSLRHSARAYLRGEILSDSQLKSLGFLTDGPPDPPSDNDVLRALSQISGDRPVVLCFDQVEALLTDEVGLREFANVLVGYLQDPKLTNVVLIISCLRDRWAQRLKAGGFQMFDGRRTELPLDRPTPDMLIDLVRRRVADENESHGRDPLYPFDAQSFQRWVSDEVVNARAVLSAAKDKYFRWDGSSVIDMDDRPDAVDLPKVWRDAIGAVEKDSRRSVANADPERVIKALERLYAIVPANGCDETPGVVPDPGGVEDAGLSTGSVDRVGRLFGFETGDNRQHRTLVFVNFDPSRGAWTHHLNKIRTTMRQHDSGGVRLGLVLVTREPALPLTDNAKGVHAEIAKKYDLSHFSLSENSASYAELEAFHELTNQAYAGELLSQSHVIDSQQWTKFAVESLKLPQNNLLMRQLFATALVATAKPAETHAAAVAEVSSTTKETVQVGSHVGSAISGGDDLNGAPDVNKNGDSNSGATTPQPSSVDSGGGGASDGNIEDYARALSRDVLREMSELRVRLESVRHEVGPRFIRLIYRPKGSTTTVTRVKGRAEDLTARLPSINAVPLIETHPDGVSIDVPLPPRHCRVVTLDDVRAGSGAKTADRGCPQFPVGQDVGGNNHWADFSDPNHAHYLVAGTTGSGKSEFLKAMIYAMTQSLSPDRLRLILIDPKRVTFHVPAGSSYLGVASRGRSVLYTAAEAAPVLAWCAAETDRRYAYLQDRGLSDLAQADPDAADTPPRVVVVCDEFADLVSDPEIKSDLDLSLRKMASKSRAAGIHLVLATQRPDREVFNMQVRSNLPGRVCLKVASAADSKLVIGTPEAASLLGKGDLLWLDGVAKRRLQAPLVTDAEFRSGLQ